MDNSTELSILNAAKRLFWKHGIKRVTVEEICKEASLSKTTFYRFFNNKTDVANRVLHELFESSLSKYKNIMSQDIPFSQKIRLIVEMKHEETRGISSEFLKDILGDQSALRNRFVKERKNRELIFINDLKEAQRNGWIKKDLNIQFIHYMLKSLNEEMLNEDFVSLFEDNDDAIMQATNFFFYGILANESELR